MGYGICVVERKRREGETNPRIALRIPSWALLKREITFRMFVQKVPNDSDRRKER